MKKLLSLAVVSLLIVGVQTPALAGSHEAKTQKYINENIRSWLGSKELHRAIHQQNLNHSGLKANEISVLDGRWRAERLVGGGDLVNSKMSNDLSTFLRGIKAASGGIITEIFVMDNTSHGQNSERFYTAWTQSGHSLKPIGPTDRPVNP